MLATTRETIKIETNTSYIWLALIGALSGVPYDAPK